MVTKGRRNSQLLLLRDCYVMLCGIYLASVVYNFLTIAQQLHWKLIKTDQMHSMFLRLRPSPKMDLLFGHLPREVSRIAKFILDRGAKVNATLTSANFRRSPLVQGGLKYCPKLL